METYNWETLIYKGVSYKNYEINQYGQIRNVNTKHTLKIYKQNNKKGKPSYLYSCITLENNKTKHVMIHRSVAETFIDNKNGYKFILFKDKDHFNVNVDNLYWCDYTKDRNDTEYIQKRKRKKSEAVIKRRKKLKQKAIEYKGNKCQICGYDKCISALEFHHLDPAQKDFGISEDGFTRSWSKIQSELDKCICVCSNCHREIHYGLIDIDNIIAKL